MRDLQHRQRELVALIERLGEEELRTLSEFARFLAAQAERPAPVEIRTLRPQHETVVQAVRRLNASYPMLERHRLIGPVGDLLSAHMIDGRGPVAVIDELEALYAAEYARLASRR